MILHNDHQHKHGCHIIRNKRKDLYPSSLLKLITHPKSIISKLSKSLTEYLSLIYFLFNSHSKRKQREKYFKCPSKLKMFLGTTFLLLNLGAVGISTYVLVDAKIKAMKTTTTVSTSTTTPSKICLLFEISMK